MPNSFTEKEGNRSMYENINPYIRRVWYHTMQPDGAIHTRVIFDYELIYIKSGKATIVIEDNTYITQPGDLFIIRPKQSHSITPFPGEELVQPHIHFDLEYYPDAEEVPVSYDPLENIPASAMRYFRRDILDSFISPFPSFIRLQNPSMIELMLVDIISASKSSDNNIAELNMKSLFLRLFYHLILELTFQTDRLDVRRACLPQILVYLEHNINRTVTLDELTATFHISKSYLMHIFREAHNSTPIQYHQKLRISRAKYLLRFTNISITEIAAQLGFEDIHTFSRTFKRIEGISPSEFKLKRPF